MLVLSRKEGESIIIRDQIEVTVVDVRRNRVRLGIRAPKSVGIHREEVVMRLLEENDASQRQTAAVR